MTVDPFLHRIVLAHPTEWFVGSRKTVEALMHFKPTSGADVGAMVTMPELVAGVAE
jgi:hypothetical protein